MANFLRNWRSVCHFQQCLFNLSKKKILVLRLQSVTHQSLAYLHCNKWFQLADFPKYFKLVYLILFSVGCWRSSVVEHSARIGKNVGRKLIMDRDLYSHCNLNICFRYAQLLLCTYLKELIEGEVLGQIIDDYSQSTAQMCL